MTDRPASLRAPAVSTLTDALLVRASDTPDGLAYDVQGDRVSWGDLLSQVLRTVSALTAAGVEPGIRCAVLLPTSLDFIRAMFAVQLLGGVPIAINPKAPLSQVRRRMDELRCRVLIAGDHVRAAADASSLQGVLRLDPATFPEYLPTPPGRLRPLAADSLSHVQLTSGSAGTPKGVMITHANVLASLAASHDLLEPRAGDVLVGWLPLHHDLGLLRLLFQSLYFGISCYLIPPSMAAMRPWLETISRVRGTLTAAPDFAYRLASRLVAASRVDLRSLRAATNGGEPVRLTSIRMFERSFGVPGVVHPGYGLAEATLGVAAVRPGSALHVDPSGNVSCGRPLRGVSVRILDESGADAAPGTSGRIVIRGAVVCAGYLDDPEATAAAWQGDWFDTGDIGRLDDEGHLFVLGRRRAMIKRAGASIAPREIEEVTDQLEGVRRSAAVGVLVHDDALTEEVVIVAEVERGLSEQALDALRSAIGSAAREAVGFVPREVILLPPGSIPRTSTGKIRYDALRSQLPASVT